MVIGERIRNARLEKGLSQLDLGNLIGVSKVSICGYEIGARTPTIETLIKLLDVLELDSDYILGRDANVINTSNDAYVIKMAKDDIIIINELKKHPLLYNKLCHDPDRTIELIGRKIK